jgi:hypothetical protein
MQLWSLCGAAALLMSGWYLMLPPLRLEGPVSDPNTNIVVDAKAVVEVDHHRGISNGKGVPRVSLEPAKLAAKTCDNPRREGRF